MLLVGVARVVYPGSTLQVVSATLVALCVLLVLTLIRPYRERANNYLAISTSFALVVFLLASVCFQVLPDTALAEAAEAGVDDDEMRAAEESTLLLSADELTDATGLPTRAAHETLILTVLLMATLVCGLLTLAAVMAHELHTEQRRLGHLLSYVDGARVVLPPLAPTEKYHLFLSHVWGTGQDQMNILKRRLLEVLPEMRAFLDVDDLREGTGAEMIYCSRVVLVFCSEGYLDSKNCQRELVHAVASQRRVIALHEPEEQHGGLSHEALVSQLQMVHHGRGGVDGTTLENSRLHQWGLVEKNLVHNRWELEQINAESGGSAGGRTSRAGGTTCALLRTRQSPKSGRLRAPTFEQLMGALYPSDGDDVIEWNRLPGHQSVTVRLIASCVLNAMSDALPPSRRHLPVIVRDELAFQQVHLPALAPSEFHLFCSSHNPAAEQMLADLARANRWHLEAKKPQVERGGGGGGGSDDAGGRRDGDDESAGAAGGTALVVAREDIDELPRAAEGGGGASSLGNGPLASFGHGGSGAHGGWCWQACDLSAWRQRYHQATATPMRGTLRVTMDEADLLVPSRAPTCSRCFVYLTAETWDEERNPNLDSLVREITLAMEHKVPLLLAYEMPGIAAASSPNERATPFATFFEVTPAELIQAGIYHTIAVALKQKPEWRRASMVMLAQRVATAARDFNRSRLRRSSIGLVSARTTSFSSWLSQKRRPSGQSQAQPPPLPQQSNAPATAGPRPPRRASTGLATVRRVTILPHGASPQNASVGADSSAQPHGDRTAEVMMSTAI